MIRDFQNSDLKTDVKSKISAEYIAERHEAYSDIYHRRNLKSDDWNL